MENKILIDNAKCKLCKTCVGICPAVIFKLENEKITTKPERIHICITCGQCMAGCNEKAILVNGLTYENNFFDLPEKVDYSIPFDSLIKSRRSVRTFKEKPIPKEELQKIVDAISFAPPSFPPIKTELVVIQDKATLQKALPLMVGFYDKLLSFFNSPVKRFFIKRKVGEVKFKTMNNHLMPIIKVKLPFMKNRTEDYITRGAQAVILFHADRLSENHTEDIYIALGYGLLKAHSIGIGATAVSLISVAVDKVNELRNTFHIPEQNEVVAAMILGYPKYHYKRAIKRELKSVNWV